MPDMDNLLGETPEVWTGNDKKLGAPVLDMDELGGLLGEEPQVWGGTEEKRGAPVLEEQVLLEEPAQQTWEEHKLGAPVLDAAPALDDVMLDGGEPAAYDAVAEFCQKLQFDDALKEKFKTLDAEQQQQIVAMRAQQLGIPAPPMIPNELRPKIVEAPPEEANVELEEAPKTEEYVPSFKDQDLERAKEEAKKAPKKPQPELELTEEQKKENLRMMNQLREERERELAHKGFIQLIILTVVGLVGAIAFSIYFTSEYKQEADFALLGTVKSIAPIVGVVMGISALVLAAPVPQLKGLTKFLYGVGFVMSLFPGIPLLSQKAEGHGALNGITLALSVICCLAVVVTMSTSEGINMYNKHGNS